MPGIVRTAGTTAGYIVFYLAMLGGVAVIPLGLPGQFLIVLATLVFILAVGSANLSWGVFFLILALAILAEVLEAVLGFLGARRVKGSWRSAFAAIAGGLAGAILGSCITPIIGSLIGALLGTFLGPFLVELHRTRQTDASAKVAVAAVLGRLAGSVMKVAVACVMIAIVTVALLYGCG